MEWYCLLGMARFVLALKFRRSPGRWTKVFLRKTFSVTVEKIFCDFSVGMELENEKTENVNANDEVEAHKDAKMFMFTDINMFWARLRLILAGAVRRGLKWALRRAQNIFMPKNINTIAIIITLDGIEEINTEKMTTKHSEEYFFHQRCEKTSTNCKMASRFWLAIWFLYCWWIVPWLNKDKKTSYIFASSGDYTQYSFDERWIVLELRKTFFFSLLVDNSLLLLALRDILFTSWHITSRERERIWERIKFNFSFIGSNEKNAYNAL